MPEAVISNATLASRVDAGRPDVASAVNRINAGPNRAVLNEIERAASSEGAEVDRFIESRLDKLGRDLKPLAIAPNLPNKEGAVSRSAVDFFLSNGTQIFIDSPAVIQVRQPDGLLKQFYVGDGMRIDESRIYRLLIDQVKHAKTDRPDVPLEKQAVWIMDRTLSIFFGDPPEGVSTSDQIAQHTRDFHNGTRQALLDASPVGTGVVNFSCLENKGVLNCLYRAAMMHNLALFMGVPSAIFVGTIEKENGPRGHAFNVMNVEEDRYLIDTSMPFGNSAIIGCLKVDTLLRLLEGKPIKLSDSGRTYQAEPTLIIEALRLNAEIPDNN